MIYRSNLEAPDLEQHFKFVHRRVDHRSYGHDVLSDFSDKPEDDPVFGVHKRCWFWTHDEAAILYNVALAMRGPWLDIGGHTGWTAAHLHQFATSVVSLDPMYTNAEFRARANANIDASGHGAQWLSSFTSDEFFDQCADSFKLVGVVIDGNHDSPFPLHDAQNAAKHLMDTGVIMLHDMWGKPIQDAVTWLVSQGFGARIYSTPNGVACCWRGDFTPPDHIPDPSVNWAEVRRTRCAGFLG